MNANSSEENVGFDKVTVDLQSEPRCLVSPPWPSQRGTAVLRAAMAGVDGRWVDQAIAAVEWRTGRRRQDSLTEPGAVIVRR